jgi:hypothetical protein
VANELELAMTPKPLLLLFEPSLCAMIDKVSRILTAQRGATDAIAARSADDARTWMTKQVRDFRRGYEVAGIDLTLRITV